MTYIDGPCGLCGQPPSGYASMGDTRYCHGDWDESPTCYERASMGLGLGPIPMPRVVAYGSTHGRTPDDDPLDDPDAEWTVLRGDERPQP